MASRRFVDRHLESAFAHHQDALRAERELRIEPQIAKQVRDDRPAELGLHRVQVAAHRRIRQAPGVDELEHFRVGIEALSEPFAYRLLAALEHDVKNDRHREERDERRRSRPDQQMVVGRVQHDRNAEPREQCSQAELVVRSCLEHRGPHHGKDGGGAAVHDRRAEAAHDPRADARVLHDLQEVDVLDQRESRADGEAEDRRVDEKSDAMGANQSDDDEALQELLDDRRDVARVAREVDVQKVEHAAFAR